MPIFSSDLKLPFLGWICLAGSFLCSLISQWLWITLIIVFFWISSKDWDGGAPFYGGSLLFFRASSSQYCLGRSFPRAPYLSNSPGINFHSPSIQNLYETPRWNHHFWIWYYQFSDNDEQINFNSVESFLIFVALKHGQRTILRSWKERTTESNKIVNFAKITRSILKMLYQEWYSTGEK